MSRHVLISSVKNEGPFLLEWVAHHLVLGFDRICIASNDCTDGTDRLLDALDAAGHIRHVPSQPQPGEIPQHVGYTRIRKLEPLEDSDWLMVLDADEFLNVHAGGNRVADLTALAAPDIDVIALNGLCFTDAGQTNWQPGPICPRFHHHVGLKAKANTALKCLTRNPLRFRSIHNHHMVGYRGSLPLQVMRGDLSRWELPQNLPIWKVLRFSRRRDIRVSAAQYNHYSTKTWDSFMLRRARGRGAVALGAVENLRHTEAYFAERNVTAGQDTTIGRYGASVADLIAKFLQDPCVAAAQATCDVLYAEMAAPYRR